MDKIDHQVPPVEELLTKLREVGVRAQVLPTGAVARTVLEIGHPENLRGGTHYEVEFIDDVRELPKTDGRDRPVNTMLPTFIVARRIAPRIMAHLRAHRHPYLDAAGNVYIHQNDLIVWLQTAPARNETKKNAPALGDLTTAKRAFDRAGLKIILVLLNNPGAVKANLRALAELAGVAHGTVGNVMEELRGRYVQQFAPEQGGRRLTHIEDLLDNWATAYERKIYPKTLLKRYRAPDEQWWREVDPTKYGMMWGAEPAAARITGYLQPGVITLYCHEKIDQLFLLKNRLREDPQGDVEFRQQFWKADTTKPLQDNAPLPVIYADLLATHDPRCIDTAGRIRARYLEQLN